MFELNVLLNAIIGNFLWIVLTEFEVLRLGFTSDLIEFCLLVATAGSQIETIVFLKTLTVNTMMTNTAGKIILAMTMFSFGLAVFNTLAWPSTMVHKSEIMSCDYLKPMAMDFKRKFILTLIYTFTILIVFTVLSFGVFRGLQIRRTSDNAELIYETAMRRGDTLNTPSQERLFTIQAMILELNQEASRGIIEEDLEIQDIELDRMETSPSIEQMSVSEPEIQQNPFGCDPPSIHNVMIDEISQSEEANAEIFMNSHTSSEVQQDAFGCVPGINIIMKTIQKYMKNSMISLIFLTLLLPWYLTLVFGFISNSGCEDPTIKFMAEMSEDSLYIVTIFLPLVIKLKLDRLSE